MIYESARHDSREVEFSTLKEALQHIDGSVEDETRPWIRVKEDQNGTELPLLNSFLVIRGKVTPQIGLLLYTSEFEFLSKWKFQSENVKAVLSEIGLSNNGYVRVDCLNKKANIGLLDALTGGFIRVSPGPMGVDIIHRPELKLGVYREPLKPNQQLVCTPTGGLATPEEADWEDCILDRQERQSLGG